MDEEASGRSLGTLLGFILSILGVSGRGFGGVPGRPGGVPGRPWSPLGVFLELLRTPDRLRGGFQGLMGRHWKPLGALLEGSWSSLGPF